MRWTDLFRNFAMRHLLVAISLLLSGVFIPLAASAYHYHGRASVGGFNATEKYKGDLQSNDSFDVRTISTRLFYEGTDFWDPAADNTFTADVRDKHDFFEKNDKEKLELTDKNSFQVRTLSLRTRPEGEKIAYQIGRFAVPYAGTVFTDGGHVAYRASDSSQYGIFGGFNPRQVDKSNLKFDQDARDFGAYYHFEMQYPTWEKRFLADQAIVRETFENDPVRMYLYQNTFYQWSPANFITSLLYLDFEPKVYVQNATVTGQKQWHRLTGSASIMELDTVEYNRHQDILENLDPSPYHEVSLGGRYKISDHVLPYLKFRYGKRDADSLDRTQATLGLDLPQAASEFIDLYGQLSYKDEFTKKGASAKFGVGYYRSVWQSDLSVEAGIEKNSDGRDLHPLIADLDTGRNFSPNFFGAFGLQLAQNEEVNIFAAFFKLTYKFGESQTAPMRDKAPMRGNF